MASCVEHQDFTTKEINIQDRKLKEIEEWFYSNKESLHPHGNARARKGNVYGLVFPFSDKTPDWSDFHKFNFSDGREVYEVRSKNKTKIYPLEFWEKHEGKRPELYTETLLFIENPTTDDYTVLIARYYQTKGNPVKVNYNNVRQNWTGSIEVSNYQETHLRTFVFEKGKLASHIRYELTTGIEKQSLANLSTTCYTAIVENPPYVVCGETIYDCTIYSGGTTTQIICYENHGGGGGGSSDPSDGFCDGTECHEFPSSEIGSTLEEDLKKELEDPCAREIFDELSRIDIDNISSLNETSASITRLVLNLFKQSDKFDYIVKEGGEFKPGETANTSRAIPSGDGRYTITTNYNPQYFNKATKLSIARTMIHESMHAYLVYDLKNEPLGNTYENLTRYSEKYKTNDLNFLHHEFMPAYIEAMALSLHQWDRFYGDGGNHGWQYYKDMAWGGLTHHEKDGQLVLTDAFKANHPNTTERNRVLNIISNEATNSNSSKGTPCY